MERIKVTPRPDKAERLESVGLSFHGWDNYWNEDVCYKFTTGQIDLLEEVTNELHQMCMHAVEHIINGNRFAELQIPEQFWEPIKKSFAQGDFSLYGRFDLAYDGKMEPKMLEYNADTPTSLLESAVAQWYWLEDTHPDKDQFNSVHERLVSRWKQMPPGVQTIHFASVSENEEDWVCCHYLMDTAKQAGFDVKHVFVEDLGWDPETKYFVDADDNQIEALFKLYPWEWMMREEFGQHVTETKTRFVEPLWKALLSNKGILPILWELYPGHANLLPAFFEPGKLESYAQKPIFSREGANIVLVENGSQIASDVGPYGSEGVIYQQLYKLPCLDGCYPVIGSWVIGEESGGMCIREDVLQITTNMSNFIPHYFE